MVKKAQRRAVELARNLLAQAKGEGFCDVRHQVRLQVIEDPGAEVLHRQLEQLPSHVLPADREGSAVLPCRLDALPEMVDDDGAVHRVPDTQTDVNDNRNGNDGQAHLLTFQLAEQPRDAALGVVMDFAHAS